MALPVPPPQYFAITPGSALAGPVQRIYATGAGTLVLTSGDGSTFTNTMAANTWTPMFGYPIAAVGGTSTATGLVGEGFGASPRAS